MSIIDKTLQFFLILYVSLINLYYLWMLMADQKSCDLGYMLIVITISIIYFYFPLFLLFISYLIVLLLPFNFEKFRKRSWRMNLILFSILAFVTLLLFIFQPTQHCPVSGVSWKWIIFLKRNALFLYIIDFYIKIKCMQVCIYECFF